jgi:aconitate hydratase
MAFDIEMIKKVYENMTSRVAREIVGHPLTLTEKILYNHLWDGMPSKVFMRGTDYVDFFSDRLLVKMQLLKWLCCNLCTPESSGSCPTTVHCDQLIQAKVDAVTDLARAKHSNEVLIFFLQCLINTVVLETGLNYSSGSP